MTFAIAVAYLAGALEIRRYRGLTNGLATALAQVPEPLNQLGDWLPSVPQPLQHAVRQRIEGERAALPGLSLTPYLIGLLVMLGMLGTFLGMVVTFKGAVFALEGSADLAAIRAALAAPIKGLGFAFGTSVAGVATSAMLGLMSALSRRERLAVVRTLDARIATVFHPFTLAFQRNASFAAMQAQASALPAVVDQLQALMTPDGATRPAARYPVAEPPGPVPQRSRCGLHRPGSDRGAVAEGKPHRQRAHRGRNHPARGRVGHEGHCRGVDAPAWAGERVGAGAVEGPVQRVQCHHRMPSPTPGSRPWTPRPKPTPNW